MTQEKRLPDRLSLIRRTQSPCGCITAVDKISGYAVTERECHRAEAVRGTSSTNSR